MWHTKVVWVINYPQSSQMVDKKDHLCYNKQSFFTSADFAYLGEIGQYNER